MKIKEIIKGILDVMPIRFFINLIAKVFIVSATISYLESIGDVPIIIRLVLILWALMPMYGLLQDFYSYKEYLINKRFQKN